MHQSLSDNELAKRTQQLSLISKKRVRIEAQEKSTTGIKRKATPMKQTLCGVEVSPLALPPPLYKKCKVKYGGKKPKSLFLPVK